MFWAWTVCLPVTILNSPVASDRSLGGGDVGFGTASVRLVAGPTGAECTIASPS